jgi:hypothetical protein
MLFQLINMASSNDSRVKNSMASMNHMIVNGDHHERLLRGDASQNARIERLEEQLGIIVHTIYQGSQCLQNISSDVCN